MSRFLPILLVVGALVLGAVGISRLTYNVDLLDLLPRDLPGLAGTQMLRDTFQRPDRLVIAVEAPDPELAGKATDSLAARLQAEASLCRNVQSRPAWESNPQELAEMAAFAWWNAPPGKTRELARRLDADHLPGYLAGVVETLGVSLDGEEVALANSDPLGMTQALLETVGHATLRGGPGGSEFSSADGTFRILFAEPAAPQANYRATAVWIADLRASLSRWQTSDPAWAPVRLALTGEPAFRAEISTGMEKDMSQSVGLITLIVALLFWLLHRTLKPLVLLMAALLCANLITLGVAGLLYGSLSVMSMGFAAILIGMIEDFGVVGLHEAQNHPGEGFKAVCRRVGPGIFWSAVTTACIFGALTLSSLPGLVQLGFLTSLGILIGAAVMLFGFLPASMRLKPVRRAPAVRGWRESRGTDRLTAVLVGLAVAVAAATLVWRGLPPPRHMPGMLRPIHSEAFATFERIEQKFSPQESKETWLPVVFTASNEDSLVASLDATDRLLKAATERGEVASYFLPAGLVPRLSRQQANAPLLKALAEDKQRLRASTDEAGFTAEAFDLTARVLDFWAGWGGQLDGSTRLHWPSSSLLDGTLGAFLQPAGGKPSAAGFVVLAEGQRPADSPLARELAGRPGVHPAGWDYLNDQLRPLLGAEARRVCVPAAALLALLLPVVFRGAREIVLALGSLATGGLGLLALMSALGQTWNIVSIAAVPLTLGLGLDFTIHMIYSLRRRSQPGGGTTTGIGRALAYCGLSTGLGFGSLALAGNQGLVSLGVCAMIGVLCTLISAAFVLPWAWRMWPPKPAALADPGNE